MAPVSTIVPSPQWDARYQVPGGAHNPVGSMRNENLIINAAAAAVVGDDLPVFFPHFQAVHHHEGFQVDLEAHAPGQNMLGK